MKNFYEQFKNPIVTVVLIFIAFLVYTKVFGPIPFYINSVNTTKTDLFSSSGNGDATAVPDEGLVNIGVTKSAATVEEAQKQVNTVSGKLISDLKKLGIKDKDIKTTNYNVSPNYNNIRPMGMMAPGSSGNIEASNTPDNINGYEVTQNIEVKVKPIELVNKIIDTATKDGANLVGGTNFTFSDDLQKNLEEKATKLAVEEAKSKAESLANISGIRLGKIVNIVSNNNSPRPLYMMGSGAKAEDQTTTPTNITPGQSTVTIGVTIYYETY